MAFCEMLKTLWLTWILPALLSTTSKLIDIVFGYFYDSHRQVIPPVDDSFLLQGAVVLAQRIRNKELTSEQVVGAFISRIKRINTIINAAVDCRHELALEEARKVDQYLASPNVSLEDLKQNKPFLGVPFSTKESTSCAGLSWSLGLVSRRGVKGPEDADCVKHMKEAGAILLCVTNIPELNLWCESRNNVYGQTLNPYNTTRTVGGSSGGEASLIASCGSACGIGTDIGGSIRMPAFFCGLFGHKPTTGLVSMKGTTKRNGLEKNTMVAAGPITKYSIDLIPFLKVLINDKGKLATVDLDLPVPLTNIKFFYQEASKDPRTNAIDGESEKFFRKAVTHCQSVSGQQAQKLTLAGMQFQYRLWRYWMTKEPYQFDTELGNGKKVNVFCELPKFVFNMSDYTGAAMIKLIDGYLPQEKQEWAEQETEALRKELLDHLGSDGVLLYPSHPFPAPYHYSSFLRPFNFGYWAIFNALHLPVTQVPLGLNKDCLPLGLQVVAAPFNDRLCLAVARELEQAFGGYVPPFTR